MIDTIGECERLLLNSAMSTARLHRQHPQALLFEGQTVLGFVLIYSETANLISAWELHLSEIVAQHQFALRLANAKAWNTYAVLLASDTAKPPEQVTLSAIEENLVGTRKIARAGVISAEAVRAALLPLLPIQHAPKLEAIDMKAEILVRSAGLPTPVVDAFLSSASDSTVARLLEELP